MEIFNKLHSNSYGHFILTTPLTLSLFRLRLKQIDFSSIPKSSSKSCSRLRAMAKLTRYLGETLPYDSKHRSDFNKTAGR